MTEKDVLARIGETLIQIQRTEITINFCIRHVLPLKAKPAKDVFRPAGRRAPLGALIAELRPLPRISLRSSWLRSLNNRLKDDDTK
jgi:hypothetical protein